jgi:hypothetical protein
MSKAVSRRNAEVVRQPIAVKADSRRRLEERLTLRFPRALALLSRVVLRLPPRSRLRQAIVLRATQLGLEAANRRDSKVAFQDRWQADWGGFRFEPEELIDLGNRVLVVGHMKGSGLSGGAAVDNDWAYLVTFSGGRVRHEQIFLDRGEALEVVGSGRSRCWKSTSKPGQRAATPGFCPGRNSALSSRSRLRSVGALRGGSNRCLRSSA